MIAPDEADDLPEIRDPLGAAVAQLIACVFEALPTDCPERRAALVTTIEAHTRIAALLGRPRLN